MGTEYSGAASIVNGNISMKTWDDFSLLCGYVIVGLVFSILLSGKCDILGLEDKTIAFPYEISAAVIMAVVGGPCFILLLRRSSREYEQS